MYTLFDLLSKIHIDLSFLKYVPLDVFLGLSIAFFIYFKMSGGFNVVDTNSKLFFSFIFTNVLFSILTIILYVIASILFMFNGPNETMWIYTYGILQFIINPEIAPILLIGYPTFLLSTFLMGLFYD